MECLVKNFAIKLITIKGSVRTSTEFTAIDSTDNANITIKFWNVSDQFSNNDKILIEYSSIQLGAKAVVTNTAYVKITVLESNCVSPIILESSVVAPSNQKLGTFKNIKDFVESVQTVGNIEGVPIVVYYNHKSI